MNIGVGEHEPIVVFSLVHYPKSARILGLARLGLDRGPLARTLGLRFWRLLGTGSFDGPADLQRYGLFTVWDSLSALQQFEAQSPVMQRIYQRADEVWTVYMRPVLWHGAWGGRDPFAGMTPIAPPDPGPWIILTRASIRLLCLWSFHRVRPGIAKQLAQQPELIKSVGIGEAPPFHIGTLSLWHSLPAITAFAYGPAAHIEAVRRTRQERWYSEECFARLCPVASVGTWDGVNPLNP
jgi:heme-degrading monooxygenase HmoA